MDNAINAETNERPKTARTGVSERVASLAARVITVGAYVLIVGTVGIAWKGRRTGLSVGAALKAAALEGQLRVGERGFPAGPTLYYVFQKEDCVDVLTTAATWNTLSTSGRLAVVGILLNPPADEVGVAEIVRGAGFKFPVVAAKDRAVVESMNRLGFFQTPAAIFVDGQGRVLLAAPGASVGAANAVRTILSGSKA